MISTFTSARVTRWAGGVLVVASSALGIGVGSIATATVASAASANPPAVVTISPASATVAVGGCSALTAFANQTGGAPADGWPLTVQVTESAAAGSASPLSACTVGGGTATTVLGNGVVGGSAGFLGLGATPGTATLRFTSTTNAAGQIKVGVKSSAAGDVSVVAYYNNSVNAAPAAGNTTTSNTEAVTVSGTAPTTTASKLTVTPTTQTEYVGSGASYTVTALDASNSPVSGAGVDYVVSGPDPQTPVRQCGGNTAADGTATCTITNGGTAGTDTITFYINVSGGTAGPDSGEPQATATAIFQALPASGLSVSAASCSNTDTQALPAAPAGFPAPTCANSTAKQNVTFSAAVVNSSSQPVSGVAVSWNRTSSTGGPSPADSSLSAQTCTTSSAGTCSVTLNEPHPASGEQLQYTASVGTSSKTATAAWQAPVATYFSVNPTLETVSNGQSTAFKPTVLDQFDAGVPGQSLSYLVTAGRNAGKSGSGTTGSDGTVSFGYVDANTVPSQTTDTVQFSDATSLTTTHPTATVNYISGSTQAGLIALDVSGNCNTASPTSTNANAAGTGTIKVCALVTNASGTKLLGKSVTFAVSIGKVDSTTPQAAGAGPSVTVNTDSNGVATAYVSSTTVGAQTVTAASDSVSATGTVTYSTSVASLHTVTIAPATTQFSPGASQTFTATATDGNGNPVAGAQLLFVTSGPGTIGGGSNQLQTTAANGTASVVLTSAATDSGSGTVTVSVQNDAATQCHATGGTCTAVASYTVKTGAGSATLLLFPQKNVDAGSSAAEGVEVVTLNADGTVAPNVLVRITVAGANNGTGAVTTNASGAAVFAYDATNAGTDTISAYEDLNDNQVKDTGEPAAATTATIFPPGTTPGGGGGKEHPTLVVTQKHINSHQEKLTLAVTSHPALAGAKVTFYQVKKGHRQKIGPGTTGSKGKVTGTLRAAHHLTLKFQVKVTGKAGVKTGYSTVKTVHVK
ncbi:MAG TPA: hypothetical protein VHV76_12925 [Mycobacteriales bacterium]|nr:hypothetical protein [Mycobacteriales bacterium]